MLKGLHEIIEPILRWRFMMKQDTTVNVKEHELENTNSVPWDQFTHTGTYGIASLLSVPLQLVPVGKKWQACEQTAKC